MMKKILYLIIFFMVTSCYAVFSDNALELYNKGAGLMQKSQGEAVDEAIKLFNESINIEPAFLPAYYAKINALILKFEDDELKKKTTLDEALKITNTILQLKPGNDHAYYLRSLIFFDLGNDKNAERELKKALWTNPGHVDANLACFYYFLSSNSFDKANSLVRDYIQKVDVDSDVAAVFIDGFLKNKRLQDVKDIVEMILTKNPDNKNLRLIAANAYKEISLYKKAITNYEIARQLGFKDKFIAFNLGFCYAGIQDYEKAIMETRQFCEENPEHIGAKNNLAVYLEFNEQLKEAADIWQSIKNDSNSSTEYVERAEKHLSELNR